MPVVSDDDDDENKVYYQTYTKSLHMVSQYSGLNFSEAMELDCYTFKVLVRDSFIDWMNQSKEGREYLENCWILSQTNPDRESLRSQYSKGGK